MTIRFDFYKAERDRRQQELYAKQRRENQLKKDKWSLYTKKMGGLQDHISSSGGLSSTVYTNQGGTSDDKNTNSANEDLSALRALKASDTSTIKDSVEGEVDYSDTNTNYTRSRNKVYDYEPLSDEELYAKADKLLADHFSKINPNKGLLEEGLANADATLEQLKKENKDLYERIVRDLQRERDEARQNFMMNRDVVAEQQFDRGRKLAERLASRGLMGSGLGRAGAIQERMATGQQLSQLARGYDKTQTQISDRLQNAGVDKQNRDSKYQLATDKAKTSLKTAFDQDKRAVEQYKHQTRESLKEAIRKGDWQSYQKALKDYEIANNEFLKTQEDQDRKLQMLMDAERYRAEGYGGMADIIEADIAKRYGEDALKDLRTGKAPKTDDFSTNEAATQLYGHDWSFGRHDLHGTGTEIRMPDGSMRHFDSPKDATAYVQSQVDQVTGQPGAIKVVRNLKGLGKNIRFVVKTPQGGEKTVETIEEAMKLLGIQ